MKKVRLPLLCTAVFASVSAAWAQIPVSVPETPLTLVVPTGSTIATRKTPGAMANHAAAWVLDIGGPTVKGYRTNFNVLVSVAKPGVGYDASAGGRMASEFKQALPGAQNVTTGTLTVGGEKAAYVAGVGKVKNFVIRAKSVQFVHAGQRYTITFTSEASAYARYVSSFDKSLATVKWQ